MNNASKGRCVTVTPSGKKDGGDFPAWAANVNCKRKDRFAGWTRTADHGLLLGFPLMAKGNFQGPME